MWHIDGCLRELLQSLVLDVVDYDCQQDWNRKRKNQTEQIEHQRVSDQTIEVIGAEKCVEVLEADPGTSSNAFDRLVIFESDLHAVHRQVIEQENVDQSRQDEDIQPAIVYDRMKPSPEPVVEGPFRDYMRLVHGTRSFPDNSLCNQKRMSVSNSIACNLCF